MRERIEEKLKRRILSHLREGPLYRASKGGYLAGKRLLDPIIRPRRFRCYGLGLGKSGTHSLAALFGREYHSAHEPYDKELIGKLLEREQGRLSRAAFRAYLRRRDRHLWLEIEVSTLLIHYAEDLAEMYPEARFVLLMRDPFSWINSSWNQLALRDRAEWYRDLDAWRYGADARDYGDPSEAEALGPHRLPGVRSHFRLWGDHYRRLRKNLPAERTLLIRLLDWEAAPQRLAEFLTLPAEHLRMEEREQYRARGNLGLIHRIDGKYLHELAEAYCGDLVREWFPSIGSREAAVAAGVLPPPEEGGSR
ncbi:MAG: hypothetical protein GVY10_01615 [Verrucomicrobia bacterium]|jgi:hypothetical protein|nr:hypothetical protein [Verrucomicrobiota bacterium]